MNAARSSRLALRAQSRLCSTGSKDPRATPAGVSVCSSLDHTASELCGFLCLVTAAPDPRQGQHIGQWSIATVPSAP
jgi:hypothetical protein